jgi:hypothetical protein
MLMKGMDDRCAFGRLNRFQDRTLRVITPGPGVSEPQMGQYVNRGGSGRD